MRRLLKTQIAFMSVLSLILSGCGDTFQSKELKMVRKLSPHATTKENEDIYELQPLNSFSWKNPEVQELEDRIAKARRERVEQRLAFLNDERVEFKKPVLTYKNDGSKEVLIEVHYKGEIFPTKFLSAKDHGEHFMFRKVSGFDLKEISLQGMCLGEKIFCSKLAIEAAYYHPYKGKKLKITSQFELNKAEEPDVEEENLAPETPETPEGENIDGLLDGPSNSEATEERKEEAPALNKSPLPEGADQIDSLNGGVPIQEEASLQIQIDAGKASAPVVRTAPTRLPEPNADSLPAVDTSAPVQEPRPNPHPDIARPTTSIVPQTSGQRRTESPTPNPHPDIVHAKPLDSTGFTPQTSGHRRPEAPTPNPHPDIVQPQAQEEEPKLSAPNIDLSVSQPQAPSDNTDTITAPSAIAPQPVSRTSPQQPQKPHVDTASTPLDNPPPPPPAPEDNEVSDLAPVSSPRPRARPDRPKTADETISIEVTDPDFVAGSGRIVFPDIEADTDVVEVFNTDTAESYSSFLRPQARPDDLMEGRSASGILLSNIQSKRFNQSKLLYYNTGYLSESTQLDSNINGAQVNPGRRTRQYGSGLMIDFLKYISTELNKKYQNAPVCINDISAPGGRRLGGHGSHRNGLDADISYPSTSNSCSGSHYFSNWDNLKSRDNTFYERNWEFINIMLSTQRVHVIFTDNNFISGLCSYVKSSTGLTKSERNRVFRKLHHISGHRNHYHVRLVCNEQNLGCQKQGTLTGSSCD